LNRHRYDIWEKDKVIQGIDRRVGIQAHEIESLKEQVSYYDDPAIGRESLGVCLDFQGLILLTGGERIRA